MKKDNNSNKCVNVKSEEIHEYTMDDIKFIVHVINKNENTQAVVSRLKSVIVNHTNTKN